MRVLPLVPARSYAAAARVWSICETLFLGWAFLPFLYFARGIFSVAFAVPVLIYSCLAGAPLYIGAFLFRSGARDLIAKRRWWCPKLLAAPLLSAALFALALSLLPRSLEEILQTLSNTRSFEIFYKFAYPIANVLTNAAFLLILPFVDGPREFRAESLPA
jgi:hypothetical protein